MLGLNFRFVGGTYLDLHLFILFIYLFMVYNETCIKKTDIFIILLVKHFQMIMTHMRCDICPSLEFSFLIFKGY